MSESGRVVSEKKTATVLFSRIYRFCIYLLDYAPEEMISNLGEYLTEMVNVIINSGGTVMHVGDEIMAVYGPPDRMPDHAERACLTALEISRSLNRLKERWTKEGKEIFDTGIGINTGDMLLGSKQPSDFWVIGNAVGLGANLPSANKVYHTMNYIVISEFTKNELSDKIVTRELDTVRVVGRNKPVTIFELIGERDIDVYADEYLAHFNEGLGNYKNQEWDKAIEEFKKALNYNEDYLSTMYIKRCNHFKEYPPGSDWDGVLTLRTK